MRRSTVLSLPLQLLFTDLTFRSSLLLRNFEEATRINPETSVPLGLTLATGRIFTIKSGSHLEGDSLGYAPALLSNSSLGWKGFSAMNSLAY